MYSTLASIYDSTVANFMGLIDRRAGMGRYSLSHAAYQAQLDAGYHNHDRLFDLIDDLHEFIMHHPYLKEWMKEVEDLYGWLAIQRPAEELQVAVLQGRLKLAKVVEAVVIYLDHDPNVIVRKFSQYLDIRLL